MCYNIEQPLLVNQNGNDPKQIQGSYSQQPATYAFNYWRNIAQKYSQGLERIKRDISKFNKIDATLNKVRQDLVTQKKSFQRLNAHVINLEQSIQSNSSYLEYIKNSLSNKVSKKGLVDRKLTSYIHILSRESPYLNTNVPRFFIYEKLVPWECTIDLYDPPFIELAADTFNNVRYSRIGEWHLFLVGKYRKRRCKTPKTKFLI